MSDVVLSRCVEVLQRFGVTEIFLFGSRANGSATVHSDYDFAVRGLDPRSLFAAIGSLEDEVGVLVDIVSLDDRTPFALHVESKIMEGFATRVA
jgi:predicted nucleotidyltransferase